MIVPEAVALATTVVVPDVDPAMVKPPDPIAGVISDGVFANTKAPVPVSSVTADARFAEDGVARKVAIPVASPLTPVEIGNPLQLESVPDDGVPRAPPLTTKRPKN